MVPEDPMSDFELTGIQQRVLGCLIEKQLSTPDAYPLTLNALVNACNQTTNRDPVLALDEEAVTEALEGLRDAQAVWYVSGAGSRVQKFAHRLEEALGLSVQECAILAELLLRGPQTPGELRSRCSRMYPFPDLAEVEAVLSVMLESESPLAARLPRQPGTKETRYAHLLGGAVPEAAALPESAGPTRSQRLEAEVASLKEELVRLRTEFDAFRRQFE
jgi:uncharacterized protein YceH (UPF0502 family)